MPISIGAGRRVGGRAIALCAALFALTAPPASAQEVLGPSSAACQPGAPGPSALVRIYGFKDRSGNLRVQVYNDDPGEFLASGKKLSRTEMPVTPEGDMSVCVPLPHLGTFALVVLHDRDANGKLSIWSDGVGFSNNPELRLGKPKLDQVTFTAREGVTLLDIVLNYRTGLFTVRPIAKVDD